MRLRQQKSILDSVTDKIGALSREIGPQDQMKVEQYTEAIRDVERRIEKAEEQIDIELPNIEQPEGAPADFEDHLELMMDLKLLALQADLTRVITFMIGKEQSPRPYPQIDVPDAHHRFHITTTSRSWSSACQNQPLPHPALLPVFGQASSDPRWDGTLLDNMTILYGLGNLQQHPALRPNLPLLVMGGGAAPSKAVDTSRTPRTRGWRTCSSHSWTSWSAGGQDRSEHRSATDRSAPGDLNSHV